MFDPISIITSPSTISFNSLSLSNHSLINLFFLESFPLKFKIKDKFDVVVCYHVIEHIKNPLTFLLNLKKILKKNGYLILGTPDFDSAMARRYENKYRLLQDKTHISLFSLDSISRLLRKENFEIKLIDFPYFDTDYFNKKNLLRLFLTKKTSPPFYGSFITILSKINN